MTRKHSGESAFPAVIPYEHSEAQGKDYPVFERSGMELRDYFAGQILANPVLAPYTDTGGWNENTVAKLAYTLADAMMEARKK